MAIRQYVNNKTEGQIYTKYMLAQKPGAKLGILYLSDDPGKDYRLGVRDVLGHKCGSLVVKEASYEDTDATAKSQLIALKASGADVLLVAATPKFAVQAIQTVHDLNWHRTFFLNGWSTSVSLVMVPAGANNGIGIITAGRMKDSSSKDDPGINEYRAFRAKYLPDADIRQPYYRCVRRQRGDATGAEAMQWRILPANIMKQAANLHDAYDPVLLPGIKVNTSPTNFHPIKAMLLCMWNGKTWDRIGGVVEGAS